ncbi:hypothetical protein SAMN03159496_01843 [Rhizobium sp. NFR07]|uniref:hypothetical protein n=1 Tax=Rhizobium sp. NFR07 TaxID=1566262 RepID=UPI0008E0701E|nr:hypothetical protein [Rhizobium sp. NFR07]SFB09840.1 hypothetical protein SAMN03159496_01843 [Rhizobium sp. NFR07]
MNAAGERLTAIAGPRAGVLPFYDLDWDLALGLAENLSRFPGGQSALSFLDAGLMARCLFSPSERRMLARHLVLPAGGILSGLMFRMMGARSSVGQLCSAGFVPALLTYAERPMTVAVRHGDITQAERLRDRLQRHAPWHRVVLAADRSIDQCDVMIAPGSPSAGRGMRAEVAGDMRANLTIFAGSKSLSIGE